MADDRQVVRHDTRDDRRELHRLLSLLPPAARVAFVQSCCDRATLRGTRSRPSVAARTHELASRARRDDSADRRLALELFYDLWVLAIHYDFDLGGALTRLERTVRGRGLAPPPSGRPGGGRRRTS